jgi:hypothetical protein
MVEEVRLVRLVLICCPMLLIQASFVALLWALILNFLSSKTTSKQLRVLEPSLRRTISEATSD